MYDIHNFLTKIKYKKSLIRFFRWGIKVECLQIWISVSILVFKHLYQVYYCNTQDNSCWKETLSDLCFLL